MPKALLLAQWYGPSDPELEDALADRLRFRRFVRLPLDGGVPDGTTRCRFRGELARRRLTDRLLAAVDAPLVACGLVPRRGMLIDASLVEADADLRKGPDGRPVTAEREAGFATRRGKAFFGFKAHLAVDEGSGPVRRAILTPANVHESVVADVLPIGDEAAVCAGKGCDSGARHARLAGRAVFDGIMRRGHRHRPLTPDEVARNRSLVPIRAGIERTYGTLKRRYGWVRVRYRGLASNAAHLDLLCLALNLRRLDVLTRRDGRGSPPRLRTASWWPRAAGDRPAIPPGNHPGTVDRHSKTVFRRGLSECQPRRRVARDLGWVARICMMMVRVHTTRQYWLRAG